MNAKPRHTPNWNDWREAIAAHFEKALLTGAGSTPPEQEDIHRFRAALKFARALLRLAPPTLSVEARQLRRELGKTAQRLARIRDHYIFLETLHSLGKPKFDHPSTVLKGKSAASLLGARIRLTELQKQFDRLALPENDIDQLLQAHKRCKKRAHRLKPHHWKTASASAIHAYRSVLVVLSCQSIFLNDLTGHPRKSRLTKLDRIRGYLGEFNDLDRFLALAKTKRFKALLKDDVSVLSRARSRQSALRGRLAKLI